MKQCLTSSRLEDDYTWFPNLEEIRWMEEGICNNLDKKLSLIISHPLILSITKLWTMTVLFLNSLYYISLTSHNDLQAPSVQTSSKLYAYYVFLINFRFQSVNYKCRHNIDTYRSSYSPARPHHTPQSSSTMLTMHTATTCSHHATPLIIYSVMQ